MASAPNRPMRRNALRWLPCALLIGLVSCSSAPGPTVLRLVGSRLGLAEVTSWTMSGQRDGAQTKARALLILGTGQTLQIDLTLEYDPKPLLAGGSWNMGEESGTLTAEIIRFVGGQGEGPSVGGAYVLVDARNLPRYRVTLPLTPIAPPGPQ